MKNKREKLKKIHEINLILIFCDYSYENNIVKKKNIIAKKEKNYQNRNVISLHIARLTNFKYYISKKIMKY